MLLFLAIFPFGLLYSAFTGEANTVWIPVSIVLILLELVVVLAFVDHHTHGQIQKWVKERSGR